MSGTNGSHHCIRYYMYQFNSKPISELLQVLIRVLKLFMNKTPFVTTQPKNKNLKFKDSLFKI